MYTPSPRFILLSTCVIVVIICFQSCRLLEKMDLEECVLITDATLIHLAMGCPRLEKLVNILLKFIYYTILYY